MQDEVIYRYLTGKCSPEEEQQIQEWYQQAPENHTPVPLAISQYFMVA